MRLAVVGSGDDSGLGASYVRAAVALGHDAFLVAADELVAGSRRIFLARRFSVEKLISWDLLQQLHDTIREIDPSLVIIIKGQFIPGSWIEELRKSIAVPIVNYYPDHPLWPSHTDRQLQQALLSYDEVLTWSDLVAESLSGHGIKSVRVVPFAYDPDLYRAPTNHIEPRWDASLIGQFYLSRLSFLLAVADFDLIVSGRGWERGAAGTPIGARVGEQYYPGREVCRLYWESKVAFNIVAPWNAQTHNMRTYEIPAARTVMIATRTPEHEALFGDDGAILVESPQEARSALLALVRDPDRRLAVAEEGHRRVSEHTYSKRMASLLSKWTANAQ